MKLHKEASSSSGLTRRYWFEAALSRGNVRRGVSIAHLIDGNKLTVSASTTIGCPYRCNFCAQGTIDPQPLSAVQIYDQIEAILQDCQPTLLNGIRFDVSGEPLANWPSVKEAISRLSQHYDSPSILIVTAAPKTRWYPEVFALGREYKNLTLQFSVHASTESERRERFGENRLLSLAEISRKGKEWIKVTGRRCSFTYALDGLTNATPASAERLEQLLPPSVWNCQITPTYIVTPRGGRALGRSQLPVFRQELEKRGYSVTIYAPVDGLEIRAVPGLI